MNRARRNGLRLAFGLGAAALLPAAGAASARSASLAWRDRAMLAFGTTLWLRAGHADGATAQAGIDAAAAAVLGVEQRMSLFRPDSDIVRLNRDGVLAQPHPDLVALLRTALRVARASGGRFDPTVQPLWQAWQSAHARGRRPSEAELRRATSLVGWRGLEVRDDRIRFARPGMAITLNGIAQGHAADLARAALQAHGIRDGLLDTGEWMPLGHAPEGGLWRLGVADPRATGRVLAELAADGRAIACSADDKMAFSADRRDHHILDPHSGCSPTALSCVVVAAPTATMADALTKVLFMGSASDALAAAARWRVDVLAVDKAGRLVASPGLRATLAG